MEEQQMEDKNIMTELEQMREQMQVLREKLEKQEIVNDKLVRRAVKSKMSWIKKFVYIEFLLLPIIALVWFGIKEMFDLSWFNYAVLMVMCTIDAAWDYRINVASLDLEKVEDHNLTDTMHKLVTMKQMRAKSFFIMMPLCALWFVWTGVEMWQNVDSLGDADSILRAAGYGGFGGLIIGIPIGLFAAFRIYRKMQNTNDELISQIEEFSNDQADTDTENIGETKATIRLFSAKRKLTGKQIAEHKPQTTWGKIKYAAIFGIGILLDLFVDIDDTIEDKLSK